MSSHTHYGHIAGAENPDPLFHSAHTRFARHFHNRNEGATIGPVFADRPKIHPVQPPMVRRMVAYHHRNPPEAGVVVHPRESPWTSHRVYLRLDPAPSFFDVEWALSMLGFDDTAAGRREFDEFVMDVDLDDFVWEPGPQVAPVIRSEPVGIDWAALVATARAVTGLSATVPINSRRRIAAATRWLVIRIAVEDLGQSYSAAATTLGISVGGAFNLLTRKSRTAELARFEAELRRRLGMTGSGRSAECG